MTKLIHIVCATCRLVEERTSSLSNVFCDDRSRAPFAASLRHHQALAEPHYCETYADMVFALRSR